MRFKHLAKSLSLGVLTFGLICLGGVANAKAQAFTEAFDVVPVPGWTVQNNSNPVGTTGWFQGNPASFNSQAGAANSYIGANYNNTGDTGTISNWLISPSRTLKNGDTISFWTRTAGTGAFPDRLQLRISTNGGASPGTLVTDVGDFTTLLRDINPTYIVGGTGYPVVWTQFTDVLSGLPPAGVTGRIAFRYFVEDAGLNGANSNYIGIDTFSYAPTTAAGVGVTGRVLTSADGRGLVGAKVRLTDQAGIVRLVTTGKGGLYSFDDLEPGQTYIISVASRLYNYQPQVIQMNDNVSELNFVPE